MADSPIGIFDSGYGGLTVARAVLDQLPHEPVFYLGDTARAPYGPRPIAEVRKYALECLDQLVEHGVKMLVIACNSASSAMLRDARERYSVPVIEVIHPAARRAVAATRNGRIGVISTQATKTSQAYEDAMAAVPNVKLVTQACPRFVEFVEDGVTGGAELNKAAHGYLDPVAAADVDTLILGCTHYPLLTGVISYVMGPDVTLISSAEETAKDVYHALAELGLMRDETLDAPVHEFRTTGDPERFREIGRRFLGPELSDVARAVTLSKRMTSSPTTENAANPAGTRIDGRTIDQLRPVTITRNWLDHAEGSVLVEFGRTRVLCAASVTEGVPRWRKGSGLGWVTAEYAMLPRATHDRSDRESVKGRIGGRTHEISRLIGRAVRAVVDYKALGENTIVLDCDVLQADGGTRTAAITGAYVALEDAVGWLRGRGAIKGKHEPLSGSVCAVSVGIIDGKPMLDLCYEEDVRAETDMNVVCTGDGRFVEVQGTAEGAPFDRRELGDLLDLAELGCRELTLLQNKALGR